MLGLRLSYRPDGCPIAHTQKLRIRVLGNKGNGLMRHYFSFVAVMKSSLNFSATFLKEHGMSFLDVRMMGTVHDMLSYCFLTSKSHQSYYSYIRVAKLLQKKPTILDMIEETEEERMAARTPGFSRHEESALFTSWTEEALLLVCVASDYLWNPTKHFPTHDLSSCNSGKYLLR